jgi:hypothetical protein
LSSIIEKFGSTDKVFDCIMEVPLLDIGQDYHDSDIQKFSLNPAGSI